MENLDDIPDHLLPGIKVKRNRQRVKEIKSDRRFLRLEWAWCRSTLRDAPKWVKLLLVLKLQASLDQADDWFKPRQSLLKEAGLMDAHYSHVLAHLEKCGLVEVKKRPGRRSLVKLTDLSNS